MKLWSRKGRTSEAYYKEAKIEELLQEFVIEGD